MATMGVGTNILGYGNKEVDNAVKKSSPKWQYEYIKLY